MPNLISKGIFARIYIGVSASYITALLACLQFVVVHKISASSVPPKKSFVVILLFTKSGIINMQGSFIVCLFIGEASLSTKASQMIMLI